MFVLLRIVLNEQNIDDTLVLKRWNLYFTTRTESFCRKAVAIFVAMKLTVSVC